MEATTVDTDTLYRPSKCNSCEETFFVDSDTCPHCGGDDINDDWNSLLSNYSKHDVGEAYFRGRADQLGLCVESWGIDKRFDDDALIFDNKMDLRLWEPLEGQSYPPDPWGFTPQDAVHEQPIELQTYGEAMAALDSLSMDDFETHTWELAGLVDIKTKSSSSWMGKFNLRHLAHYAEHAANYDVPVFVYFTVVDMDAERVGEESFVSPIPTDWAWEPLVDHYDRNDPYQLSGEELNETARTCDAVSSVFRAPDGNMVVDVADDCQHTFDWVIEEVL